MKHLNVVRPAFHWNFDTSISSRRKLLRVFATADIELCAISIAQTTSCKMFRGITRISKLTTGLVCVCLQFGESISAQILKLSQWVLAAFLFFLQPHTSSNKRVWADAPKLAVFWWPWLESTRWQSDKSYRPAFSTSRQRLKLTTCPLSPVHCKTLAVKLCKAANAYLAFLISTGTFKFLSCQL